MSESAIQKLLRLKKEKAEEAAKASAAPIESNPIEPATPVPEQEPTAQLSAIERLRQIKMGVSSNVQNVPAVEPERKVQSSEVLADSSVASSSVATPIDVSVDTPTKPRSTHPLAMEMAELEQALDAQVPGFVSILSTIHKKLRADPDNVTTLSEDEIAVIVRGLEQHTQITIVAPSAVKAAKKAAKVAVTAADL